MDFLSGFIELFLLVAFKRLHLFSLILPSDSIALSVLFERRVVNHCMNLKTKTSRMKSKYLLLLLMLIFSGLTFAQKKEIKGKVIDQSTGDPLAGVSIITNKSNIFQR